MTSLLIACDGSCIGNGKENAPVGWAWADENGNWLSNGAKHGTNQRAELHAIWSVLKFHPKGDLVIQMDSKYAINCVSNWAKGWEAKGWKKANGEPVLNLDLIRPAYELLKKHEGNVEFMWVKGHRKDNEFPLNTLADKYAYEASSRVRDGVVSAEGEYYLDSKGRTTLTPEANFVKRTYTS